MEGVKTFAAEAPEKINLLFEQKIEGLQKQQKDYQDILEQLRQAQPVGLMPPKFQLFEGQDGVRHILKDMLLYRNLETQAFWPIKAMVDMLSPDFFRYLNKERIKNHVYTRAIWPREQVVDVATHPYLGAGEGFLREIRVAPEGVAFSMGYWIYGSKVAFISSRKESFGFILESAELVEMLRAQFEVLWQLSTVLNTKSEKTEAFL